MIEDLIVELYICEVYQSNVFYVIEHNVLNIIVLYLLKVFANRFIAFKSVLCFVA